MACPICKTGKTSIFFESRLSVSVRSDSVPLQQPVTVYRCAGCGHLFKDLAAVQSASDYQAYDTKRDKVDFSGPMPKTRSKALLDDLRARGVLGPETRVLDYGCNRGMFLELLGTGNHGGYDVAEQYRNSVEALGFRYFTPAAFPPADTFDLLTLIHVYEHLPAPAENLHAGVLALKETGSVVIQLPDPRIQPTDLYVVDHCHHFSAATLDRSLAESGLIPDEKQSSPVPGEITRTYKKAPGSRGVTPSSSAASRTASENSAAPEKIRLALVAAEKTLLEFKASGKPCVIYGCGSLGILTAEVLRGQATAFIDDDPSTHGMKIQGLSVSALSVFQGTGTTVVVAVQPSSSLKVARNCEKNGFSVIVPYLPAL